MEGYIVAPATPRLVSALSLVRISGEGALEATDKLFGKPVSNVTKRSSFVGTLSYKGNPIDEVVLIVYPHPHSYTGEDVVEVICHGSPLIVDEIIDAYVSLGGRLAGPGEFTARAFYNGKMDLVEASSVDDLIKAVSKEGKNLALKSLKGESSELLWPIRERLGALLASIEVGIDYPEYEDIEKTNREDVIVSAKEIRNSLYTLIKKSQEGAVVANGVSVAIVGEPNVGKSSLLNAFLHSDKAIVSPIPGTTRDIVEGVVTINGITYRFLDTAGLRESGDTIEEIGMERSRRAMEEADIILRIHDASNTDGETFEAPEGKTIIDVYNKSDLSNGKDQKHPMASAINGDVEEVIEAMEKHLSLSEEAFSSPSLYSKREIGLLQRMDGYLENAIKEAEKDAPLDLVSGEIFSAYNTAREILGEEATNNLEEEIFSRFCVGK